MKSQSVSMLQSDTMEQKSVNQMMIELMDASYYRHVYFMLSSIQGMRKKHEVATRAIRNIYEASNQDSLEDSGALVRSILHSALTDISYRIFIFNQKDPDKSFYVKPEYKEIIHYDTIQFTKFSRLLKKSVFNRDMTFLYLKKPETKEEFICSVSPMSDTNLIVIVSSLNNMLPLRAAVRGTILSNIKIPLEKMNSEFIGKNSWQHYVLDRTGKVLVPHSIKVKIDFTRELINEIKEDPDSTITKSMEINGEPTKLVITLYRPLNWYIVSSISDENILKSQKNMQKNIFYICIVMALITLVCTYFLAASISKPLNTLISSTHKIAKTDLRNTKEIKNLIRGLNEEDRQDELGEIAKVLSKMIFSLSLNMNILLDRQNHQKLMEGELSAASDIQQGLLPSDLDLPEYLPFNIYGSLKPAKEVGGDLYDVISLPNHKLCITIGDVSDKGVPAALFMTMTVTLIREGVSLHLQPAALMNVVNQALSKHNPNLMFVTLFIGILDKESGELTYANGGHCQPLIVNRDGQVRTLEQLSGPAVGVDEERNYLEFKDSISSDDMLLLYTDGVTEAQNINNELYGDERLSSFLKQHAKLSSQEFAQALTKELTQFKGDAPQFDDITMLVLRHK
ncbi:MAG: SpoIIE family protein phosphatase [Succinivibrio sp.]|nr:SpoIIE family protein phosphatase [Succinivibrio sp.]